MPGRGDTEDILYGITPARGSAAIKSGLGMLSITIDQLQSIGEVYLLSGYDPAGAGWLPMDTEDAFFRDCNQLFHGPTFQRWPSKAGKSACYRYKSDAGEEMNIYFPDLELDLVRRDDREMVLIDDIGYSWTGALQQLQERFGLKPRE